MMDEIWRKYAWRQGTMESNVTHTVIQRLQALTQKSLKMLPVTPEKTEAKYKHF